MNGITIFIVLAILIVVILLLVLIIINLNKKKKKINKKPIDDIVSMPNVYNLFLPSKVEDISKRELPVVVRKIFNSFKYLDYKNMSLDELDKKEWHSWQVSVLLLMYKRDEEFFIPEQEKYFHPFLLNSNENNMKSLMTTIIKKYNNYVEVSKSKDQLSKDYIWTNRDASIIFYFLANYKTYSKN